MPQTTRSFVSTLGLLAVLLGVSSTAAAQAECQPGDLLCAEVEVGPFGGRLRIGGGGEAPPPPPPVVVVPPPPPPPPVVVVPPPPPPPVVVVPPPAPPPVVVAPPPATATVIITATTNAAPPPPMAPPPVAVERRRRVRYELVPVFDLGAHIGLGGMFSDHNIAMGGFSGALRIRPIPHLAIDVGAGLWGGTDYNNAERWELPVTADLLVFFNPEHLFQVYGLVGAGVSWAQIGRSRRGDPPDYVYVGGELGLGFELRWTRFFAMNVDVRGFLRENVTGGAPEFSETTATGGIRSTNTSGGVTANVGMTFYFLGT